MRIHYKTFAAMAIVFACMGVSAQTPIYLDENQPIENRVKDALSRMTLEEKVAVCHSQAKFSSYGVPRLGIPELWMSDGPHGVRSEVKWNDWPNADWTNDSITAFPALTCLAATWNPQMAALYGSALSEEALYRGKDVMLGPGLNIYRTPLNGRNFEYMGEDPYLTSRMCIPYIQEVQKNGVSVCVKHYCLNNQELWRGHINVKVSERALREIYLPAFKAAVTEAGAWSVMGAYNQYLGQHACHNEVLLNKILKEEWGFDGALVSDWGGTHNSYQAALFGLDIEMGTWVNDAAGKQDNNRNYLGYGYLNLIKEGKVPMSVVDEKASRVLRLIFRTAMNSKKSYGALCTAGHYAACREIGEEGIVLLKNEPVKKGESPLLPVEVNGKGGILVVGDNAVCDMTKGGGSSELKAKDVVSPLRGLRELYGERIAYVQGYVSDEKKVDELKMLADEAVEKARTASLVLFVGGLNKQGGQDCEGVDRTSYALPYGQSALIERIAAVNPNIAVVLVSGNAVEMPWISHVPAVVQGWYLGTDGGHALAAVLSGSVNPSGKLPFSFPVKLQDCGAHAFDSLCYPGNNVDVEYKEDILVGYRWYETKKIKPLFAFGHGLSYTTFDYGKLSVQSDGTLGGEVTVSVEVTNSGKRAGKEVVQLYVGDDKCSVLRPVKELKAFQKIELQPAETQTVTFVLKPDVWKYFDEPSHAFKAEPGKFTISVGSSSADIRAKASVKLL